MWYFYHTAWFPYRFPEQKLIERAISNYLKMCQVGIA
jgi:hypothetical protein